MLWDSSYLVMSMRSKEAQAMPALTTPLCNSYFGLLDNEKEFNEE